MDTATKQPLTPRPAPGDEAGSQLPDPSDFPLADVVIFDGNCRFCRSQIRRLQRWDPGHRLAFLSLHDPRVQQRFPDLTFDQLMEQVYVVDRKGRRHAGAGALRYLSRRLPLLWWAAPALHLPGTRGLWQFAYRQVARRRYRISQRLDPCDDAACRIHDPKASR